MAGAILSSKRRSDGKIVMDVLVDPSEIKHLKGNMDDIFLFSEHVSHLKTNISTRGKKGATKYLLIPRDLRDDISLDKQVMCQKIDLKDKVIILYAIEKKLLSV